MASCTGAPPKTGTTRQVSLPTFLARQLEAHAQGLAPTDLLFTAPEGGPTRHEQFTARVFRPVVKGQPAKPARPKVQGHAAQPPKPAVPSPLPAAKARTMRWHDLRHTCASLLISNGASIMLVSQRLGHASKRMTLDTYSHLYPSEDAALASALDAAHAGTVQPLHGHQEDTG